MSNVCSIDTDAGIASILSNFDSDYITHVVSDSLNMRFRPYQDEMPNFVDILERSFNGICDNAVEYRDEVNNVRLETYKEIINIITKYYNLTFTGDFDNMNPLEIYGITKTIYDIFVSRYTEHMFYFFIKYIMDNCESIYDNIIKDPNTKKPKEIVGYTADNYIDSRYLVIHANINTIIYNMASFDIPLYQLLLTMTDQNTAMVLNNVLIDNNDIYKYYYANFILDPKTTADMITNIKLRLQAYTQKQTELYQGEL